MYMEDATDHFLDNNLNGVYVKTLATLPHTLEINSFYYAFVKLYIT